MISRDQYKQVQTQAKTMLDKLGLMITAEEAERIEVVDFGLSDLLRFGLQLVVYVNTDRVCAKEIVLFPWQTCPEHYHPSVNGRPGKEETFRCRWGDVSLYVPGEPSSDSQSSYPVEREKHFTVNHKIHLLPGDQYTIAPDTKHWFQAGSQGAIVSEFSTQSTDEHDVFTDPQIVRAPAIEP